MFTEITEKSPMEKSIVYGKAYKFAIRIVNAFKYLKQNKKEYILSKQLLRCGTSIGANVHNSKQLNKCKLTLNS